ncbi:Crotonase core [Macrophomina phaseolina MS6]|uniref:Crotonase core n=1 Tax=Macrophomina phaseolina (strain MS6) TaxID=1126212 RepID=K2QXF1_MACPH|nr:Crotonase core [Macrophomina phaseolina MS6]
MELDGGARHLIGCHTKYHAKGYYMFPKENLVFVNSIYAAFKESIYHAILTTFTRRISSYQRSPGTCNHISRSSE